MKLHYLFAGCAVAAALTACASSPPPARQAARPVDARTRMVGAPQVDVQSCLGAPAQKSGMGTTQTWTYYAGGTPSGGAVSAASTPAPSGSTSAGVTERGSCAITLVLTDARVSAVSYEKLTPAGTDAVCAARLKPCLR